MTYRCSKLLRPYSELAQPVFIIVKSEKKIVSRFNCYNIYHPGSKCEALRLEVHLILLSFINITLLTLKIFVLFRW